MYKTCIYCNRNLGLNESVENFPVGRKLAFDGAKGRLWVICGECRRWNLTPLEERWEAIEECERHYTDTRTRYSTDNIGLARLREGLDLVRIGAPLRPEYAAWRYGREFLKRHVAVEASIVYDAFVAAYEAIVFMVSGRQMIVTRVRDEEGKILPLSRADLKEVRLISADTETGWQLSVPHRTGVALREWWQDWALAGGDRTVLEGSAALRASHKILSKVNFIGGNDRHVRGAVELIEEARDVERLYKQLSAGQGWRAGALFDKDASVLRAMRPETRLALEMAASEETERRAFEGELRELEEAWREAEEIAAIADRLLVPQDIEEWIRVHREQNPIRSGGGADES